MIEQENTKEPKDDCRLDELGFQSYGKYKGEYAAKILREMAFVDEDMYWFGEANRVATEYQCQLLNN